MSLWTEWTAARAWAMALTSWHKRMHPSRWPEDPADLERQRGLVELVLAYAIQAAGRINRREPPTSPSSRDYERVRLVLLRALLTPDTLHAVILHHDTTLGPIGDQPGHDFLGPVLRISEQPERWRELADRAAGVIVDHHRDSATGDLFDPMLEIGDRHIPMIELYKARVVGSSSNERGDAR